MPEIALEIQIGADGVRRVRVFGDSWSDVEAANALLERIKPFLDLIHADLTGLPWPPDIR
jgi:hypothetical protein